MTDWYTCCGVHGIRIYTRTHLFDPTDIMANVNLVAAKKEAMNKMVYQAAFFVVLFVRFVKSRAVGVPLAAFSSTRCWYSFLSLAVFEFTNHPVVRLTLFKQLFPWVS